MLVLFETASGFALFKLLDEKKLKETDNLWKEFETADSANKIVKLVHFKKFKDTTDALEAANSLLDSKKCSKGLKKFLKKSMGDAHEKLAVADAKLGNLIKDALDIPCVADSAVQELMRGIRGQLDALVSDIPKKDMCAMSLGLAHSLSRYKLKFSPEKVDTMIVQAVSLLDDLDKELNNYNMRCREWYSWHFPELGKIVQDHIAFAKLIKTIGLRHNTSKTDLSDVISEEMEEKVKEAAEISMGTEISDVDMMHINQLCDQILEISAYRTQLSEYLKNRMMALAPNLTVLLGELVGARLISHAGSLINLAKYPASTIQILGAEKALFRALKTKKDTPKYGLVYHAQLIGAAPGKIKGKVSRMLAAKAALACRVDALGEDNNTELGIQHRAYLENRVKVLQEQGTSRISGTGKGKAKLESYSFKSDAAAYDTAADSTIPSKKRKFNDDDDDVNYDKPPTTNVADAAKADDDDEEESPKPKKKKKKVKNEPDENGDADVTIDTNGEAAEEASEEPAKKKKKKKKKVKEEPEESD